MHVNKIYSFFAFASSLYDFDSLKIPDTPSHPSPKLKVKKDSGLKSYSEYKEPKYKGTPRNAPCPCGSGKKYKKCCL